MQKLLLSLFILLPGTGFSQNLLLNGGFEEPNTCTEYKIECAPEAWISSASGLADYVKDANRAYEGEYCMSIQAGHATWPFKRTFIRSQLVCQMKKGNTYRLTMVVKSNHPILDSVGVYFGPIEPLLERKPIHLLSASLVLASNNRFVKDSSWQKAVLDYTSNGTEQYITIANFSRNDINGNTGMRFLNQFLVFLDNISLVPLDPAEKLCDNIGEVQKQIYDQNERHQYLAGILRNRPATLKIPIQPTHVVISDTLVLPDVLFSIGKKDLQQYSFVVLDSFCRSMTGRSVDSLVIDGHADNTGTVTFNEQLSSGRADAVATYLRQCAALFKSPVITRGWGSRKPVAPGDTPTSRQRNRRVELRVYFRE